MALHVYSSLSKQLEKFKPHKDRQATMYTCGPTVYGYQQIGNYRSYISWDLIKRTLEFLDYKVDHVMNITDVGHLTDDDLLASNEGQDKMEKAAAREQKTVWDIARYYEEDFLQGLDDLHIQMPNTVCRATEHIEGMIEMIEKLLEKGIAYQTKTGVYFDISKFPEYGKLSGNTLDQLEAGASGRVELMEDLKSPHDFALWITNKEQSMMWDSPWGRGFPGWHIECSAMSRQYLGDSIDIHTGGIDNKFPHHECEIAQSEGVTGKKPFVKYWLHGAMITVDGAKMSKSKGNVYLLPEVIAEGHSLRAYRFLCLQSHYRTQMDFSWKALEQVEKNMSTLDRLSERLMGAFPEGTVRREYSDLLNAFLAEVVEALEDDFNTPKAFAAIFGFVKDLNSLLDQDDLSQAEVDATKGLLETIDSVFEVLLPWEDDQAQGEIPQEIHALVEKRQQAKEAKEYDKADRIRIELDELGYVLEDSKDGTKVRRK